MIEGALILLAGILIGRFAPARRKSKPLKVACECGHGYHDHKAEAPHSCKAKVYLGGVYRDCTCQRYNGPVPLPAEYFAPEIAP